jgi:hypothetical protein
VSNNSLEYAAADAHRDIKDRQMQKEMKELSGNLQALE